jgi:hypothetical protein
MIVVTLNNPGRAPTVWARFVSWDDAMVFLRELKVDFPTAEIHVVRTMTPVRR